MPLFTPTRAIVVLTSFILISLLWNRGLPHQYGAPGLPVHGHNASKEKPTGAQLIDDAAGKGGGSQEKGGSSPSTADIGPEKDCKHVRGADKVMIIVRTSKSELGDELSAPLKTLLSCVANVLIFSDHQGSIDGIPIHNALDTIPNATKSKHDEFLEYNKMQADKAYSLSADKAEALDKWKHLPMVYTAATLAPNHRFYMLIEAHTALSWTNLLQWLHRLDYRIPYYVGTPNTMYDKRYAQREPGILLSYAALQQYRTAYEDLYAAEWESQISTACCGHVVLATAMKQSRVEQYSSTGLLEADKPSTLEWTHKFWCTPVVSWHHLSAEETELFHASQKDWTQKHGWAEPYTHRNAFEHFVKPHLAETKDDWDNISSDTQLKALPKALPKGAFSNQHRRR